MQYLVKPLATYSGSGPLFYQQNTQPRATPNVSRMYVIVSAKSGLVLTESNGKIIQKRWNEEQSQQWKIIPLENSQYVNGNIYLKGTCKIECVANNKVLDVPESSTVDEVQLITWSWTENNNQKWRLVELDKGAYRIENVHSDKVIDLHAGSKDEGAVIQQYRPTPDNDGQKWILCEVQSKNFLFKEQVTIYKDDSYHGWSQKLGPGKYDEGDIVFGSKELTSFRVPEGLRITLYEHPNFRGDKRMFARDYDFYHDGGHFNDKTSAILVEKVATFYNDYNYRGNKKLILGIGRYDLSRIGGSAGTPPNGTGDFDINWNNQILSMKVPEGLLVTLYKNTNFTGNPFVFDQDISDLREYSYPNAAGTAVGPGSIIIKELGIVIPDDALNFGATISLKSYGNKWMSARADRSVNQQPVDRTWEKFTIIRAGDTKHNSLVSYGDIVAVKSNINNLYLCARTDGSVKADQETIVGDSEKFVIVRVGNTQSDIFVCKDDAIALQSVAHKKYLTANGSSDNDPVVARSENLGTEQKWTISTYTPPSTQDEGAGACGAAVSQWSAGVGFCGAAACLGDACGIAACGAAAALFSACGGATTAIAVCGVAGTIAGIAGVTICATALVGLTACGADVCGAAGCGAAACGAAACGAAGCGADACGGAACGGAVSIAGASLTNICGADAGGLDYCLNDLCGANVCAINLCPADACLVDACLINLIPIVPFI